MFWNIIANIIITGLKLKFLYALPIFDEMCGEWSSSISMKEVKLKWVRVDCYVTIININVRDLRCVSVSFCRCWYWSESELIVWFGCTRVCDGNQSDNRNVWVTMKFGCCCAFLLILEWEVHTWDEMKGQVSFRISNLIWHALESKSRWINHREEEFIPAVTFYKSPFISSWVDFKIVGISWQIFPVLEIFQTPNKSSTILNKIGWFFLDLIHWKLQNWPPWYHFGFHYFWVTWTLALKIRLNFLFPNHVP